MSSAIRRRFKLRGNFRIIAKGSCSCSQTNFHSLSFISRRNKKFLLSPAPEKNLSNIFRSWFYRCWASPQIIENDAFIYETETLSTTILRYVVCNLSYREITMYVTWFSFLLLVVALFVEKLEITNTGIDSFYGSIKTLSLATAFLHNVEEFCSRLFGFYFKICMRRHQGKRLEGKKKKSQSMRCCYSNNVFLLTFANLFFLSSHCSRHCFGTFHISHFRVFSESQTTDASCLLSCLVELWVASENFL